MDAKPDFKQQSSSGPIIVKNDTSNDGNSSVERFCEPCNYFDKTYKKECNGFCVECTEYLCSECIHDHRKNKITRQHGVLEKDDLPQDISPFLQLKEMSKCVSHLDRMVDFECVDHNKLICSLCLSRDHRDCKTINDLKANEKSIKLDLESVLDFVERTSQNEKGIVKENELHLKDLENKRQEINSVCNEYVQSVKGHINRINSEVKSKAATVMSSERTSIEHTITEYSQFKPEIERVYELLKISQHGKYVEKAAVVKYVTKQVQQLNTSVSNVQKRQLHSRNISPETALACLKSLCKITSNSSDELLLSNSGRTQSNQECMVSTDDKTEDAACKSVPLTDPARLHMCSDTKVKTECPSTTTSTFNKNTSPAKTRREIHSSVASTQPVFPLPTKSEFLTYAVIRRDSAKHVPSNASITRERCDVPITNAINEVSSTHERSDTSVVRDKLDALITHSVSGSSTTHSNTSGVTANVTPVPVPSLEYSYVGVRAHGDTYSPSIVACANLPGNRIAILDNINNKVKFLSDQHEFQFQLYVHFKLSGKPSDMCAFITESQHTFLYVCFPQLKQIQKISVMAKRQNSVVEKIETKFHPISITTIGSHVIVLSKSCIDGLQRTTFAFEQLHVDSGNIKRISEDGHAKFASRIRSLNNTSVLFIRYNIVTCVQVAIGLGGSDIYVVGELWKILSTEDVKNITDIAVHKDDIYVCGCDSNNLKCLKSDGRWKSESIVKCEYKPQAVLFDRRKSRIIVGAYRANHLRVYRAS